MAGPAAGEVPGADRNHPEDLRRHFDVLAPRLLEKSGVPGVAVAVIRDGRVAFTGTWGEARVSTATPVRPGTLFNVGSIAKPLTAWGVMRLVERGQVRLDVPVWQYLGGWRIPDGPFDVAGVTVGRLLAHTAGISMSAVPSRPADQPPIPTLRALQEPDHALSLDREPGTEWSYSGGGYLLLQLLIEEVSGKPFPDFMKEEVLDPLGMRDSRFGRPADASRAGLAQAYEDGHPAPDLQWPGLAAAGLYTTVDDLARFVVSALRSTSPGADALPPSPLFDPSLARIMVRPAPATDRAYGTRYGLGHDLWPLPDGRFAAGHNGQNTGWAAAAWWVPGTGDGIVVLTNDSGGMAVHRWLVCDWIAWADEPAFGGYCRGRREQPAGTLQPGPGSEPGLPEGAGPWWRGRVGEGQPGGVLVVRRWGRPLVTEARGLRSLEGSDSLEATTPFYIASIAKPLTATVVRDLVDRGVLDPCADLGGVFEELPFLDGVTVSQLLNHTAGVPDYFQWIDWPRLRRLDDRGVVDTLANHGTAVGPPPGRFAYSNSHYVLLAELVRRVTGRPLSRTLLEEDAAPLRLSSLWVDDGDEPPPAGTAEGYVPDAGSFRLSSYETLDLPGPAPRVSLAFATTGAGGVYMSAADLARWGEARLDELGPTPGRAPVPVPSEGLGDVIGDLVGYLDGWFVSRLDGHTVYWHDGNRGGFDGVLAIVPVEGISAAFLANRSDLEPEQIVSDALRAVWGSRTEQ
ncbi:MAG: serine hydrolase domain-containing protein [Gemmatimonadota bacterium]